MTVPSPSFYMSQVKTEIGEPAPGYTLSARLRTLTGVASGTIPLSAAAGKSWMTASASPTFVSGFGSTFNINTTTTTCTPSGGSGSYSYLWSEVPGSASGGPMTITSPSTATTAFRGAAMDVGESRAALYVCTVTDLVTGAIAVSNQVSGDVAHS